SAQAYHSPALASQVVVKKPLNRKGTFLTVFLLAKVSSSQRPTWKLIFVSRWTRNPNEYLLFQ
ncbi:hypothetical protein, partial [Alteromonas macleodii]|uniref:hypothetical protein n=1 Tax=Alteromonas macleodii TaxID=28108 RepID=UPI001E35597C